MTYYSSGGVTRRVLPDGSLGEVVSSRAAGTTQASTPSSSAGAGKADPSWEASIERVCGCGGIGDARTDR